MNDRKRYRTRPEEEARARASSRAIGSDDVGVDELKDAVLRMIVERFGDRKLTWETVEMALSLANFEVKQAAMFASS